MLRINIIAKYNRIQTKTYAIKLQDKYIIED